jgi:hypothetical protein
MGKMLVPGARRTEAISRTSSTAIGILDRVVLVGRSSGVRVTNRGKSSTPGLTTPSMQEDSKGLVACMPMHMLAQAHFLGHAFFTYAQQAGRN